MGVKLLGAYKPFSVVLVGSIYHEFHEWGEWHEFTDIDSYNSFIRLNVSFVFVKGSSGNR